MISAATIGEIIRNPALAGNHSPAELAEIRDKFPYCSTLHLLYLKSLSLGNDLQFEEHLRYAAIHVVDRERMYYLIHSNAENQQELAARATTVSEQAALEKPVIELKIVAEEAAIEHKPVPEKIAEPVAELKTEPVKTEEPVVVLKPVSEVVSTPIDEVDEVNTSDPSIEEEEKPAQKIETAVESTIVSEKIEELVVPEMTQPTEEIKSPEAEHVISENTPVIKTNILDAAPDLVEIAYTEDLNAEEAVYQEKISALIDEAAAVKKAADEEPVNTVSETEEEPDLSHLSFIEWLQYKQNKKLPSKEEIPAKKTSELPEKDKKQAISTEKQAKKAKTNLSRSDVDALLNKFITEEPSISRPTATFFSPAKNAKQSLEEAPELVTETLAKIYVLQKNYAKAIQAYEQLSLVYPEKKTFFATRIQKIKDDQQKQ